MTTRLLLLTLGFFTLLNTASAQHTEPDSAKATTKFNQGNIYDPLQLIQGRIPGVSITRPGGDINQDFQIRIRGLNTITPENRPLIILDNMVGVSLDNIDPNDIESITIIKENAAAALYGMRGANGVIIVTSKRARTAEPMVSAHASTSIDRIGKTYDMLGRDAFLALGGPDFGANTDWIEETTQTGLSEVAGFLISQKLDKTTFSMSANYRNIEGIISPSFQKRLNARFSVEQLLFDDKLKVSGQVFITNSESGTVNPLAFREMTTYNPTAPIFDASNTASGGYFQQNIFDAFNPQAILDQQESLQENKSFLINFSATYEVLAGLNLNASYTQNNTNTFGGQYWSRNDWAFGRNVSGAGNRSTVDQLTEIVDFSANYEKTLKGIDFNFLLGGGYQNRENEGFSAQVTQFLFDAQTFNNLGFGAITSNQFANYVRSSRTDDRLNSIYGSVNAQFSENFSAYLNLRSDTYSGFINNKTGLFYGIGLEYNLINVLEQGKLSNLSLHASYGTSGNLPPSPNLAESFRVPSFPIDIDGDANTTNDISVPGVEAQSRNPLLQWEQTREFNLGLDFALGTLGLSGSIDYFTRSSEDIILQEFVAIGSPNAFDPGNFHSTSTVYSNGIDISTAGLEFTLNYQQAIGRLNWQSSLNVTKYQPNTLDRAGAFSNNQISLFYGGGSFSVGGRSNVMTRNILGEAIGDLYAPRLISVNDNGSVQVSTQNFDEWEKVGNALPTTDLGFFNQFGYGDWNLSFMLRGSFGHSLLNVTRMFYEPQALAASVYNTVVTDKYAGARDFTFSDNYIEKAGFLRLNHVTIGRTFNLKRGHSLILELIGQNLFTITSYSGNDPEARYTTAGSINSFRQAFSAGVDERSEYFTTRTYTLALRFQL